MHKRWTTGLALFGAAAALWCTDSWAREYPPHILQRFRKPGEAMTFGRATGGWKHLAQNGRLAPSRAPNQGVLAQAKATMRVPVFLMHYKNEFADWEKSAIERLLFGDWPTGSLRDAYLEYTYQRLEVSGDVFDWFQLAKTRSFYEQPFKDAKGQPCAGLCEDRPGGAAEMLRETLEQWDPGVDFSAYDNDGVDGKPNSGDDDGIVDSVFLVHNGSGGECGGSDVFSHYYQFSEWFDSPFETNERRPNGEPILINDYVMQPAIACDRKSMIELGVFAHEFGHALYLPDLYDTDFSSGGVGEWDLMGRGGYGGDSRTPERPTHPSAWSKIFVGLITPVEAVPGSLGISGVNLPAVEKAPVAYKLKITESEYFLIECRMKLGYDQDLPAEGILIWHADEKVCDEEYDDNTVNDDENHRCLQLLEADGRDSLLRSGGRADDGDPFPGSANVTVWNCDTNPGSLGYGQARPDCVGLHIEQIGEPTDDGCPIAVTKLTDPKPGTKLNAVSLSPRLELAFSRPLIKDLDLLKAFTLEPEAGLDGSISDDRNLISLKPRLAQGASYTIASTSELKDELSTPVEPFSITIDTLPPSDCPLGCCCNQIRCETDAIDASWGGTLVWLVALLVKRHRRNRPCAESDEGV